jgi:hypothetical protein
MSNKKKIDAILNANVEEGGEGVGGETADSDKSTDIFEVMRRDREQVLKERDSLNKTLIETLYENLRLPLGMAFFVLGGMQNQLYAWSHDFASQDYVGVPVSNDFLDFTGAEWEYFNVFFAQGSAIILAILGGYFVGQAIWKKDAEIHLDNKKLDVIRNMEGVGNEAKKEIDSYLAAKRRWIPDFEEELKKQHPLMYKINQMLRMRGSLIFAIMAHTLVLSAIHYTWSQRYYEEEVYVGGFLHESVFWNWSWFMGAYSTYVVLCLTAYYFFYSRMKRKPAKMVNKLRSSIDKLNTKLMKYRDKGKDTGNKKYIFQLDKLIRLQKELTFWKSLE